MGGISRILEGIIDRANQSCYQVYGTSRRSTERIDHNFPRLGLANRNLVVEFDLHLGEFRFQRILTGDFSGLFREEFFNG